MPSDAIAVPALGAPAPHALPSTWFRTPPDGRTTLAALRVLARGTGMLLPGTTVLYRTDKNDRQICQVAVTRLPYPGGHPIRYGAEADLDESFTGTDAWWDGTRIALAEVAEARALRMAFPELRGLLTVNEPDAVPEPAATEPEAMGRVA